MFDWIWRKGILTEIAFTEQAAGFGGRRRRWWALKLRGCRSSTRAHGICSMHCDKVNGFNGDYARVLGITLELCVVVVEYAWGGRMFWSAVDMHGDDAAMTSLLSPLPYLDLAVCFSVRPWGVKAVLLSMCTIGKLRFRNRINVCHVWDPFI